MSFFDSAVKGRIVQGIRNRRVRIDVSTNANIVDLVRAALREDPRIVYHLDRVRTESLGRGRYVLLPQYRNEEVSPACVAYGATLKDCIMHFEEFARQCVDRAVIVTGLRTDVDRFYDTVRIRASGAQANLLKFGLGQYQSYEEFRVLDVRFTYRIGRFKLRQMEQDVAAEVKRIGKILFHAGMPPEVKVYLAHNYLTTTVTYDLKADNDLEMSYRQSAYGALLRHRCVCQGYANAFKLLMDAAGVYCEIVVGPILGTDEYHAWNIVRLSGRKHCHIDVTWDDTNAHRPGYMYFCRSDRYFDGKRAWERSLHTPCEEGVTALNAARQYVAANRKKLLAYGIDPKILDC